MQLKKNISRETHICSQYFIGIKNVKLISFFSFLNVKNIVLAFLQQTLDEIPCLFHFSQLESINLLQGLTNSSRDGRYYLTIVVTDELFDIETKEVAIYLLYRLWWPYDRLSLLIF